MARRRAKTRTVRRRRTSPKRTRRRSRARGFVQKGGLATLAGLAITGYRFWKEYKWLNDFKDAQGRNPYAKFGPKFAGIMGLYQKVDANSPTGYTYGGFEDYVQWATADFSTQARPHTNIVQRVSPVVIGKGISMFVGGRGWKGIPGLGMNKYLPGGWKL